MATLECTDVDRSKVRELYCSDVVAQTVFDYLKSHGAGASETKLDDVEHGLAEGGAAPSRSELIDFFKALEELGLGTYIVGRRGRTSRFRWATDPVEAAVVAAGGAPHAGDSGMDDAGSDGADGALTGTITHEFVLRSDFTVKLMLPADLSTDEASRLAGFVKTLPFE
ncbi:MAG: hypothetical protein ACE5EO_09085 [Candidatus Krumholzibacteriia bacterium]